MARYFILVAIFLAACTVVQAPPPNNGTGGQPPPTNGTTDPVPPVSQAPELCLDLAVYDLDSMPEEEWTAAQDAAMPLEESADDLSAILDPSGYGYIDVSSQLEQDVAAIMSHCEDESGRCSFQLVTATDNYYGDMGTGAAARPPFDVQATIDLGGPVWLEADAMDVVLLPLATGEPPDVMVTAMRGEGNEVVMMFSYPDLTQRWKQKFVMYVEGEPCDIFLELFADVTCDDRKDILVSHSCGDPNTGNETVRREAWALDPGSGEYVKIGEAVMPSDY